MSSLHWVERGSRALFREDVVQHLHEDGEVLALIVGREDDRVFVLRFGTHLAKG